MKILQILLLFTSVLVISNQADCQITKTGADSLTKRSGSEENNSSGRTPKDIAVSIYGRISSEQAASFIDALKKTKGINSVKLEFSSTEMAHLNINTSLNQDELIESIKKWNPQLSYLVRMQAERTIALDQYTPEEDKQVFMKVYFDPRPQEGWAQYLKQNLNVNIPKANGASAGMYTVTVRFMVHKDGSLSDIEAKSYPKPAYGMEKEAVRVIEKGPRWLPGRNDGGRAVNAYVSQPVIFMIPK